MTDASILAQSMTSAVALMGAMVAGLSVYFSYKGRHNQFRQVVYGRQMDAYFDITEAMSNLFTAAENLLAFRNPQCKGEDACGRFLFLPQPEGIWVSKKGFLMTSDFGLNFRTSFVPVG